MLVRTITKTLLTVLLKMILENLSGSIARDDKDKSGSGIVEFMRPSKSRVDQSVKGGLQALYMNKASGFGTGLLLGGAAGGILGAAVALWYAPQGGRKTQAMLKHEAAKLQKKVTKKANNLYASAEDIATGASDRITELAEHGKEFVEDTTRSLKTAVAR